ncbi:PTS lactose/cellobiose transporter subunit IIA [Leuconostoc gelidum subsp. aenigmaticum]|uniref:PTS lactose/cellobiose transporter subunit IIA n=1 Tax=Leuconostoc gelidum TaxID=1244 RepID=UPI001CC75631|nr:PTS lactose/cellobiose transporter subunit IIA [Leuconostoc gelidum]MBZ6003480.1 PTS lactose/cellobiose transporter subunit IIA [Leuconostoc gelidum subsp. aenigmaticum]
MDDNYLNVVMGIIMNAGNAKGLAHEALEAAKLNDFEKADQLMTESNQALAEAHNVQSDMLTKEAQGDHTEVNLYMIHAQDHLMTAITYQDLVKELITLYKKNMNLA